MELIGAAAPIRTKSLLPFGQDAPIDARVLGFVVAVSVGRALRPGSHTSRDAGRPGGRQKGRGTQRHFDPLMAEQGASWSLQVAISLVLRVGAGLFLIGVRIALGAQRGAIVSMVMRESMAIAAFGVALGLAAGRLVAAVLFGLNPTDAWVISAAVAWMALVGIGAGHLPARRASRVDPMTALRYE